MNLELEAYEGELRELREAVESWKEIVRNENSLTQKYKDGYDAAMRIIKPQFPDKFPNQYFICGEGGTKNNADLPEKLYVCPAMGTDWFQVYERTDESGGTEW